MKLLLSFLLLFSYSGAKADTTGLQTFETYKNNYSLLTSDIIRLEEFARKEVNPVYKETLSQYKHLLAHYATFNARMSLVKFSKDTAERGWKRLTKISKDLSLPCEVSKNTQLCLVGLMKLQNFVTTSNLSSVDKQSVSFFLKNYSDEFKAMVSFDEVFIKRFDANSAYVNEKKFSPGVKSATSAGVSALSKVKTTKEITASKFPVATSLGQKLKGIPPSAWMISAGPFIVSLLLLVMIRIKSHSPSLFYKRFFRLGKTNRMMLRLFGRLGKDEIRQIKKIEKSLFLAISSSRLFLSSAEVKIKSHEDFLSIETLYFTNRSIQNFIEKESSAFKLSLENLQETVESFGGEMSLSTKFNFQGEVIQASFMISLPEQKIS